MLTICQKKRAKTDYSEWYGGGDGHVTTQSTSIWLRLNSGQFNQAKFKFNSTLSHTHTPTSVRISDSWFYQKKNIYIHNKTACHNEETEKNSAHTKFLFIQI